MEHKRKGEGEPAEQVTPIQATIALQHAIPKSIPEENKKKVDPNFYTEILKGKDIKSFEKGIYLHTDKKAVSKITLRDDSILILKVYEYEGEKECTKNQIYREHWLGKFLSSISPNIVKTLDLKELRKSQTIRYEMLMKYGGESLYDFDLKKLTDNDFLFIVWQLAYVLELLGSLGIAHCDIKEQNIVIYFDNDLNNYRLKLIDFGASISFKSTPEQIKKQLTNEFSNRFTGFTKSYAAPEISKCESSKDYSSLIPQKLDVYSFGMTLFYMLLRRKNEPLECYMDGENGKPLIKVFQEKLKEDDLSKIIISCLDDCPENRQEFSNIRKTLEELLHSRHQSLTERYKLVGKVNYAKLAKFFHNQTEYDVAIYYYEKWLPDLYTEGNVDKKLYALNNYSGALSKVGQPEKAKDLLQDIIKKLDQNEMLYNAIIYSMSHFRFGELYRESGDYESASILFEIAKSELEKANLKHSKYYFHILKAEGDVYTQLSRFEEAKKNLVDSIDFFGTSNERIPLAASYSSYGLLLASKGNLEPAMSNYEKAEKILQEVAGKNDADLLNLYLLMAEAFLKLYPDIKNTYLEKAENMTKIVYHEDHPKNAEIEDLLGKEAHSKKEYIEAIKHFQKSLKIKQKNLPKDHREIGISFCNIAIANENIFDSTISEENKKKTVTEAISNFEQSREILIKALGNDHFKIIEIDEDLAKLRKEMQKLKKGERIQKK